MQFGSADLKFDRIALDEDAGLETAIILSLFTDRRANADDILPGGPDDRRGWWGDGFPPVFGDRIGSRLWLLNREKQMAVVVERARQYATEALTWLTEDGVATRIDVLAEISAPSTLGLLVTIHRPRKSAIDYRYWYAWEAQSARKAA